MGGERVRLMRGVGGDVHAPVAGERRFEDFGLERLAVLLGSSVRLLHPSRFCVLEGLSVLCCRSRRLHFKLYLRARRHLHWSAALLLVANAADLDPRIAVKRRTRMRSLWWGARFVLQAARQRISKDHTAATDVRLACCFRRC